MVDLTCLEQSPGNFGTLDNQEQLVIFLKYIISFSNPVRSSCPVFTNLLDIFSLKCQSFGLVNWISLELCFSEN